MALVYKVMHLLFPERIEHMVHVVDGLARFGLRLAYYLGSRNFLSFFRNNACVAS